MITPIRGRKAIHSCTALAFANMIRNDNPDKGTEGGLPKRMLQPLEQRLEMITPIRGRKYVKRGDILLYEFQIRNDNPDKGTEDYLHVSTALLSYVGLEMITPIRGRKLYSGWIYTSVFS